MSSIGNILLFLESCGITNLLKKNYLKDNKRESNPHDNKYDFLF